MRDRPVAADAPTPLTDFGILIVAHAPAASALQALVAHVDATWLSRVAVFDMRPEMSREDAAGHIAALIRDRGWTHSLVLVDLAGSGPYLAAVQALRSAGSGKACIVTGCNAAMLCSVLAQRSFSSLMQAARYARSRGRRGITVLEAGAG